MPIARKPALQWVRPDSPAECGVCCLAMVVRYHGVPIALDDLRARMKTGRDGTNALHLMEVAEELGFTSHGIGIGAESIATLKVPAILHWEGMHFVVLESAERGEIWVVDPVAGRRRVEAATFAKQFSGTAIVLDPPARAAVLPRVTRPRAPARGGGWKIQLMAALAEAGLPLAAALGLRAAGPAAPAGIVLWCALFALLCGAGEWARRGRARSAGGAVHGTLAAAYAAGVALVLPSAGAPVACAVLLRAAIGAIRARRTADLAEDARLHSRALAVRTAEARKARAALAVGAYHTLRARVRASAMVRDRAAARLLAADPVTRAAGVALEGFALAWVLLGGAWGGTAAPETLLLAAALAAAALGRARLLPATGEPLAPAAPQGRAARASRTAGTPRPRGVLSVRGVTFQYGGAAAPVLRGVSLEVAPGERVAILGDAGSGKSTLLRVLAGSAHPAEGTVLLGGTDLRDLGDEALPAAVSLCGEDPAIFDTTIADNVTLASGPLHHTVITQICEQVGIHAEVMEMPLGYGTSAGPGGSHLSASQRQRISIARALAMRPSVLAIDHPAAYLDPVHARALIDSVARTGCAVVFAVSDPRMAATADRVIVLNRGKVVESGLPAELRKQGGLFAAMLEPAGTRRNA
jgi:ABC-type transport system involved in cytochrome bd biosynthesis fused ATPase/permease subunit